MVLTGDEDSGDGLLAVFCARVIFADILDVDSSAFTALCFEELYKCWLEQIEVGVITTHIEEQDSAFYKPGEFLSDHNDLILETGAFLVGLSPQDRAALLLVYGEGFTYMQAADILKVGEAELTFSISGACSKLAGNDTYVSTVTPSKVVEPVPSAPIAAPALAPLAAAASATIPETFTPTPVKTPSLTPIATAVDDQGTFISSKKAG